MKSLIEWFKKLSFIVSNYDSNKDINKGLPITEVQKLSVADSDVLIVKIQMKITAEQRMVLGKKMLELFPKNKVVIFDNGIDFVVAKDKGV